jgi:hypothetical protein
MMWLKNLLGAARRRPTHPTTPAAEEKTLVTGPVRYRLTDPGTIPVIKEEPLPAESIQPPVKVYGFNGGGYEVETPAGQAAGVYMTIHNAIQGYNGYAESPLAKWQAVPTLSVIPRAGKQLNAYYNRQVLAFFMSPSTFLGRDIYTSDSPDIIAHELGHAILDSFRPDLWSTANLEVWAFHESFGDVMSMVSALLHPEVAQAVLDATGGDLHKDNPVCCLAEQMAQCLHSTQNPVSLRNASNAYKYVSPLGLPDEGPDEKIIAEPHSFSRIMTGALYDCLITIYKDELSAGREPMIALMNAAKGLGWYVSRAAARVPLKGKFFNAFATTVLFVDHEFSKRYYHDRFKWIFEDRGLLPSGPKLLLANDAQGTGSLIEVKLRDCLPLRALTTNPLYEVKVQIPDDGLDSVLAAQDLVQYLHKCKKVSDNFDTPFQISNGKLERTHFSCWCLRNWENPTQPEYQKPPKPENHASPSCGCGRPVAEEVEPKRVVREANIRYKSGVESWNRP